MLLRPYFVTSDNAGVRRGFLLNLQVSGRDSFEMEITEDMIKFFSKSEEHRKQRGTVFIIQLNFNGSNTFGTIKISSGQR